MIQRLVVVFSFIPILSFGQTSGQIWSEIGVKGKISKKLDWGLEVNTRFGSKDGVETFFPQASLKYKITKWFRPSIDFRYILDQDRFGNFQPANRLLVNANFEKDINKRLSVEFRARYQYEFARWSNNSGYEQSISQIVRLKPEVSYSFKNSIFRPYLNSEVYYYLEPYNPHFSKLRIGVGTDLKIDDPLSIGIGYIYDHELDNTKGLPNVKHILTTSLKFKL